MLRHTDIGRSRCNGSSHFVSRKFHSEEFPALPKTYLVYILFRVLFLDEIFKTGCHNSTEIKIRAALKKKQCSHFYSRSCGCFLFAVVVIVFPFVYVAPLCMVSKSFPI